MIFNRKIKKFVYNTLIQLIHGRAGSDSERHHIHMNASFVYDRFQQEAIDLINKGCSVIVAAPTGAGKTAIAEHVITDCINKNTGVIYTAPIKTLSNQKFRDFSRQFGDAIGIVTGDISINPYAPVLIMTTEILRNRILDDPRGLKKYAWVIYDEIHYIDNPERGTVWEESLILLPDHMRVLGLSATIPNIYSFAQWLEIVHHKPIQVIVENNRPVPLHFFFQCRDKITDNIDNRPASFFGTPNRIKSLIDHIKEHNRLPVIYFVFSRKKAQELAFELNDRDFLNPAEKKEITALYLTLCRQFFLTSEETANRLLPLIERGIAYHHAGMLPALKEVIERLFTSRLLKVIFTTETFALGINMPSRSVAFDDLRKFYGRYARNLKTRDFYQMAGRAGRRGIDDEGFVYCRVNPLKVRPEEVRRIVSGKPEEIRSQFNTSYATLLNLYEEHQDNLTEIYPLSFHYFQSRKHEKQEAMRLIQTKLKLLKAERFIETGALSRKGDFAKAIYGYELILSELYERRFLEKLECAELGALAAAIVFEPRKTQESTQDLERAYRPLRNTCNDIFNKFHAKEQKFRIYPFSKQAHWNLTACVEAWMKNKSFHEILALTDTDEGEVIRYFRMAIQVLKEMAQIPEIPTGLKSRLCDTAGLLNRDIVDAEKELREG